MNQDALTLALLIQSPNGDLPPVDAMGETWRRLAKDATEAKATGGNPAAAVERAINDLDADQAAAIRADLYEALAQLDASGGRLPRKTSWTAAELLAYSFPEPNWSIPGILPEGLSLLAGRPKLGKSWLAMQMAGAVGTGGKFFDRDVKRGKVLYLALEDSPRRIQERMKAQYWPAEASVDFETEWPDLLDGGLIELQARLAAEPHALVVIDTLSRAVRFAQKEVEDSTTALDPLQHLALDHGLTILPIDHHRKSASTVDDVIDEVLGSTAKAAVADTILGLFRDRGKVGATLKITGRDVEDLELVVQWDRETCSWQLLGDAKITPRTEAEREVLDVIDELGGKATTSQIAEETGRDAGNVSKTIGKMVDRGLLEACPREGKEVPYKRKQHN